MKRLHVIITATLLLSVASLFVEQAELESRFLLIITNLLDFAILLLLLLEVIVEMGAARSRLHYLRSHLFSLSFLLLFAGLFIYNKWLLFTGFGSQYQEVTSGVIIIRNLFLLLKVFGRFSRLISIVEGMSAHPAQTILLSFLAIILIGTLVLTMPFTTINGQGLSLPNALFTATSAVCVTGLIVVDTATHFTLWGQLIILVLIQIGGLGIMILSYFAMFVLRRSMSVKDKFLISYMLSEDDMNNLADNLKSIVYITLIVELCGAVLLFPVFYDGNGFSAATALNAVFHAVSAFCNAGFALFTDSMEQYRGNLLLNITAALLIITGGISFGVIANLRDNLGGRIRRLVRQRQLKIAKLSLNSRIVLTFTGALIITGMLLVYASEHNGVLKHLPVGEQYLAAFFQSVTLRTAGFNTIAISSLTTTTYLFMVLFMFIGAASGSTAGGIKINSVAVLGAYLRSTVSSQEQVTISRLSIPGSQVLKAFLIVLFGVSAVFLGTVILSITENAALPQLLFESVSAFGTVGLSTGITADLTLAGKLTIIVLMFMGRLGPLTVLAAAPGRERRIRVTYPTADITIG
jgi:trk system potassium uptake protein TrkH